MKTVTFSTALLLLISFNSFADCSISLSITDSVLGGNKPLQAAKVELAQKGYVVSDDKDAHFKLDLHRVTSMYEGNGPAIFAKTIDALEGKLIHVNSSQAIEVSEYREVRLLGLRSSSSFKKNVINAIKKLPACEA